MANIEIMSNDCGFGALEIGDYFVFKDELFVKISNSEEECNAFDFGDGDTVFFDLFDKVKKIPTNNIFIKVMG